MTAHVKPADLFVGAQDLAARDRLDTIQRLAEAIIMLTEESQVAAVAGQIAALAESGN